MPMPIGGTRKQKPHHECKPSLISGPPSVFTEHPEKDSVSSTASISKTSVVQTYIWKGNISTPSFHCVALRDQTPGLVASTFNSALISAPPSDIAFNFVFNHVRGSLGNFSVKVFSCAISVLKTIGPFRTVFRVEGLANTVFSLPYRTVALLTCSEGCWRKDLTWLQSQRSVKPVS